jgi:hypothetical protein
LVRRIGLLALLPLALCGWPVSHPAHAGSELVVLDRRQIIQVLDAGQAMTLYSVRLPIICLSTRATTPCLFVVIFFGQEPTPSETVLSASTTERLKIFAW